VARRADHRRVLLAERNTRMGIKEEPRCNDASRSIACLV
jgi:hypothetical protein